MSVADTDILFYGSTVMPDDDTDTEVGGAMDDTCKIEMTELTPAGTVEMVSSSGSDTTQTVTITGRNASGVIVTETKTVAGTGVVAFTTTWERILKVVMSATALGVITIRKASAGTTWVTLAIGLVQCRRLFYGALSEATGGAARTYYEKIFAYNSNDTFALTSAIIKEYADPSTVCSFAVETSLDGTDTNGAGNNRQVAPAGYTFNSTQKSVANSANFTEETGQGIWMKLDLVTGLSPTKTSVTMRVDGNTI